MCACIIPDVCHSNQMHRIRFYQKAANGRVPQGTPVICPQFILGSSSYLHIRALFVSRHPYFTQLAPIGGHLCPLFYCYKQCCVNVLAHKPLRICECIERSPGSEIAVSQDMCVQFNCLMTSLYCLQKTQSHPQYVTVTATVLPHPH